MFSTFYVVLCEGYVSKQLQKCYKNNIKMIWKCCWFTRNGRMLYSNPINNSLRKKRLKLTRCNIHCQRGAIFKTWNLGDKPLRGCWTVNIKSREKNNNNKNPTVFQHYKTNEPHILYENRVAATIQRAKKVCWVAIL